MADSKEDLKSLLMKVKESEKAGLKLNIQKTKIMASSPSTSWQIDEETMEIMTDFMATHSSTLPGKFYGQRILVGYNPWRHKELDMTE